MGKFEMACFFLLVVVLVAAPLVESDPASLPCNTPIITVTANSVAQIMTRRLQYPPTQLVAVSLQNDITITESLIFDSNFSCTNFKSSSNTVKRTIRSNSDDYPAFQILNAHNVLVQNINFAINILDNSGPCPIELPEDTNQPCGAVYIHSSWAVQLVQGTIRGRIDVCRSPQTTLDWLDISSASPEKGLVQIHLVGGGPDLIKSDVVVSNCYITGSQIGVVISRAGVGITLKQNYFKNQNFSGLQCGWGVRNVGDCMLTSFINNYFLTTPDFTPQADSSAMYFGTHWVNPGNYLSCNYVKGGKQCLYLDYATSGLEVDGMVCIGVPSGLKLNAGHANEVNSFITVGARQSGWISCQNFDINNCNMPSGQFWDSMRLSNFNSAAFQTSYPYLNNFCDIGTFNGVDCNPPGSQPAEVTGQCSGIPTGNTARVVIVDPAVVRVPALTYKSCPNITSVPALNTLTSVSTPKGLSALYFNNILTEDYGIPPLSPLRALYGPGLTSCPKKNNGPQPVLISSYLSKWNVRPNDAVDLMDS